jgi:hypothetical protein
MNLELIIDNWLAEHCPTYFVWSIPDPAYPHWAIRAYIIHSENEVLIAAIVNYKIIPTTDYKELSKPLPIGDPEFFEKFKAFIDKVSKRHK